MVREVFEGSLRNDLVVNQMHVNRVPERHRVNEIPVLGSPDLWVIAGPALAEMVVSVKEECKVDVAEERSHPDDTEAAGRVGDRCGELTACLIDGIEVVEGSTDF